MGTFRSILSSMKKVCIFYPILFLESKNQVVRFKEDKNKIFR